MYRFTAKRQMAGNICLVLFVAFFLSVVGSQGWVGEAEAQPNYNEHLAGKDITYASGKVNITIWLKPITGVTFNNILFDLSTALGIADAVYATVYENVYYEPVGTNVYKFVYVQDYTPSPGYTLKSPSLIAVDVVYLPGGDLKIVFKDAFFRPPKGGGEAPAPGPVTLPADTGKYTEDKEKGQVILEVETSKALEKAGDQAITVEIPAGVTQPTREVKLPSDLVEKATELKKDLVINTGQAKVSIPPEAIPLKDLVPAGAKAEVRLTTAEVAQARVEELLKETPPEAARGLTLAGKVLELKLEVFADGKPVEGREFSRPVTVTFNYGQVPAGVNEDKLGIYRRDEAARAWAYVGGKVDKLAKLISARLRSFSTYTVMEYNKTFADLDSHWAKADVELMASRHVAKGMTADLFEPQRQITRAQFAAFLLRALGLGEYRPAKATFTDVSGDRWYYGVVEAAAQAGLVAGYPEGDFKPERPVTREEMAAMVVRAMKAGGKEFLLGESESEQVLAGFTDGSKVSGWARVVAATAAKAGIVAGRAPGQYVPAADATRAEGLVMIKRLMGFLDAL